MAMRGILVAVAVLAGGCYGSGSLTGRADAGSDAHTDVADGHDAAVDTELDPAADHASDAWHDGSWPDIGEETPIAELVGDPIIISNDEYPGGMPEVEWNGSGWGVAWYERRPSSVFRPLDEMGSPIGPVVPLYYMFSAGIAMEWKEDHYAIASNDDSGQMIFGLFDEWGLIIEGPTFIPGTERAPGIAWSHHAEAWIMGLENLGTVMAGAFSDDDASSLGSALSVSYGSSNFRPRVVGLKTLDSILWLNDSGLHYRSFRWPDIDDAGPARMVHSYSPISDSKFRATGYNDNTVAAVMDGRSVQAIVIEPRAGEVLSGPHVIGDSSFVDGRPSLESVESRGFIGVCYPNGEGYTSGSHLGDDILFRLISPLGEPIGAALLVEADIDNNGGVCALGWSGSEFLIAYWRCGDDGHWGVWVQRVRPLI